MIINIKKQKYGIFLISVLTLLIIDLVSKYYLLHANFGEIVVIKNFFKITMHTNNGVAFGIFFGHTIQLIISITIVGLLAYFGFKYFSGKNKFYSKMLLGIIIGGAIGNVINRIHLGYVIDFISLWKFPVFNIADIGITVGLIILLILNWQEEAPHQSNLSSSA